MKKILLAMGIATTLSISTGKANTPERPFLPPLMGWSSWNTYRVNINESLIKKQADALISNGLKDVGYCYINIDDGFFGGRDNSGNMTPNRNRFPNGMKIVSDYIHSLGLKAGIYSEGGDNTCGSIWDKDTLGRGSGLYKHEQKDIDLYLKDWGYDFIKIDYCGGKELGLDEREQYTKISKAIKNTGRDDVSINICRWAFPGVWARDCARSWRISGDISPKWNSVKYIIEKNLYLSAYAGQGHYNDMDMLEIGRGLTQNEEEVHFGIWCIMSSPLLIGCDMTKIPETSLNLLKNKELIALNQDVLGLQANVVQHENGTYVLAKDIMTKRGKTRAVALYNPTDKPASFNIPLKSIELRGNVKVRDLIKQTDLPDIMSDLAYTIDAHSVKILKLTGDTRLEPDSYEAEWALLSLYDDLGKNPDIIFYENSANASGKIKVSRIGKSENNDLIWNEVYSKRGGKYKVSLFFSCKDKRNLDIYVNGEKREMEGLTSGDSDTISTVTFNVKLKKGMNTIRLTNPNGWAPDIDKMDIVRL